MSSKKKPLIAESTQNFWKEGKQKPGFSFYDRLHAYIYARWIYLYIGLGTGQHPLARKLAPHISWLGKKTVTWFGSQNSGSKKKKITFADTYHGKVVTKQAAKELVSVKEPISLPDLEKVIPYKLAREILLKNPEQIAVLDCPCRMSKEDHCEPVDVCLIIGEPFTSFVLEHHPKRSRRINQAQAAEIIEAENKRGHVQHAFFKDAMLGRFYAICNCCDCCCGAIQMHKNGTPMLASSGYVVRLDPQECIGCGSCVHSCQFGALSLQNKTLILNEELCMGCGVCTNACPHGALSLKREPTRGEPLEIFSLLKEIKIH